MASHLNGSCVLVVEDEYYLADEARSALSDVGAKVLGPVATIAEARALVDAAPAIDAVLLDVNLRDGIAFELADSLQARSIPFAFVTGYDRSALPERFKTAPCLAKPVPPERLINLFGSLAATKQAHGPD